jgi:hypothetical protein
MFGFTTEKTSRWLFKVLKGVVSAVILFLLLLPTGCKKPPPAEYLFRYRFQPDEILNYKVTMDGKGEVTLTTVSRKKEEEEITLPVDFKGRFLLEAVIDSVSSTGTAEISLSYKDFSCMITNRVRDRETTMLLTDRLMRVEESGRIKKELKAGESGFPLNGIVGSSFEIEVDSRGKLIQAQVPPDPGKDFPYMKLDNLLDQIQPEFPLAAIPVGATWSREVKVSPPESGRPWNRGQFWTIKLESTFRGFKDGGERVAIIDLSGNFRQSINPEASKAQLSGLKQSSHTLTGTIEFDLKKGLVLSSQSTLEQELDILMAIEQIAAGNKIKVHINDTTAITVKLAD